METTASVMVELSREVRGFHFRTLRHPGEFVVLAATFSEAMAGYRKFCEANPCPKLIRDEILSVEDFGQIVYPR